VLSTHSATHTGYPFGTIVPFCLDREGLPLLLLSHLAQHCKNLLENPACGLLLSEPGSGDPQQLARLSLVAECRLLDEPDPQEAERYFRYFPHSRHYYEHLHFRFFCLQPQHFHLNAGFAAARWLGSDRVIQARNFDPATEASLRTRGEREQELLHRLLQVDDGQIEITGLDNCGMDLRLEQQLQRVNFPLTVCGLNDLHTALTQMQEG